VIIGLTVSYLCWLSKLGWLSQEDKDRVRFALEDARAARLKREWRCECGVTLDSDGNCPSCAMDRAGLWERVA